ncbi:hypothetical protein ACFQNE_03785 [Gordonia phosphorivorans]|uniref:Secreted protein n=1 Tax=Gordonia phosphorivorans TaxID=1056982 RepID=A0ABV6H7W5_9ACTN
MNTLLNVADSAVVVLADQSTKGPEFGKASPIGLLVIVVLLVATFLLIRSMNKQLRKLPENFDGDHPEADQRFDEGTDTIDDAADATHGAAQSDGSAAPGPGGSAAPND